MDHLEKKGSISSLRTSQWYSDLKALDLRKIEVEVGGVRYLLCSVEPTMSHFFGEFSLIIF